MPNQGGLDPFRGPDAPFSAAPSSPDLSSASISTIRELEGTLAGYYRLRIGKYRLIFRYRNGAAIEAIFLEERSVVYEVFEAELLRRLKL